MTYLWLVRHGETEWNVAGRWQGQAPQAPGLTEVGQAQARAAAARLAQVPLTAMYTSDLLRARQTAEIIAAAVGLASVVEPRLREIGLGDWEGLLAETIARSYPEILAERERDPLCSRAPGGESVVEMSARVWAAVDEIVGAHPAGEVVVVSHGLALAAISCRANHWPLAEVWAHTPANAVPQRVEWA